MVQINSAEANRTSIRSLKETTWGTTPGAGTTRQIRLTSSSLAAAKETQTSDELRADRMVSDIVEVAASSGGTIEGEFSAGTFDEFFAAFLLANWTLDMNHWLVKGESVTVTGVSTITITGTDWTNYLTDGQYIKVEGFLNEENNGVFSVNGTPVFSSGNTVITVDETSLVVEGGSAYTKVMDAQDVILKSTTTAFTSGNTINGGGSNSFAGKTLKVGQKIHVEGLGKETASLALAGSDIADASTFALHDGVNTAVTYEFHSAEASVASGNVYIANSGNPGTLATRMHDAVMNQFRRQNSRISSVLTAGTKEAGSIAFATTAEVADQFTIDDGETSLTFTFVASGGTGLNVDIGVSAAESAENLADAINGQTTLQVTADGTSTPGTCAIVNDNYDGGTITEDTDGGADITTTDFSGGTVPSLTLTNHYGTGGTITEALAGLTAGAFSGGDTTKFGFFTIASLPDDDTIVVSETLGTDANSGALPVIIKGSHVRNGANSSEIIKQSFTLEQYFEDVGKTFVFNGQRVGGFSMSVEAGSLVTVSFDFQGRQTLTYDTTQLGNDSNYTLLSTTGTQVFNATSNVGAVVKDNVALTQAVTEIGIEGEAGLREQVAVGEKFPAGIGYGRFALSGNMMVYFEDFEFYNTFINHVVSSLQFDFTDTDQFAYFFRVPSLILTDDPISPSGIDTDVMEELEFQAKRDPALSTQFMIDRFSSVWPNTSAA